MKATRTYDDLLEEMEELRFKLQEAEDAIQAIRTGQIDAIVITNGNGPQLYSLRSADHTYRVFIEKMKEGAVTLDKNGIILYSNTQFASMIGLTPTKVIGLPFNHFVPEEVKEYVKTLIKKGRQSDSKGEISLKTEGYNALPVLLTFTTLQLDEGEALSIIITDLSMQKETEQQLKSKNEQLEEARLKADEMNRELENIVRSRTKDLFVSREHFKSLADNIPAIVWSARPDGTAVYFNKLWYEYTGLTFEESIGSAAQQVLHPDDLDSVQHAWNNAIRQQTSFQIQFRLKGAADGQYRWHLGKGEPFKDETGNLAGWFGTSADIEDQKKEIEKKDEFISVASHELKTPLTSLKGYVQLIESWENLPDPLKLYIAKANTSINKLQHLINDLLDVSKIKAGKLKFTTDDFNLTEMVNTCIESSGYMYPAHKFNKELQENIIVSGNAERLEQVLMNLINNAVKYSPDNKEITIRAQKDNGSAIVSVTDLGIGMSATDQKKVFERFYRVDDHKFLTPGLGMGLYISAEIIKEHNGTIDIKSRLNRGSTFSFSIPLPNS